MGRKPEEFFGFKTVLQIIRSLKEFSADNNVHLYTLKK